METNLLITSPILRSVRYIVSELFVKKCMQPYRDLYGDTMWSTNIVANYQGKHLEFILQFESAYVCV